MELRFTDWEFRMNVSAAGALQSFEGDTLANLGY
jgi:hypothetical protein